MKDTWNEFRNAFSPVIFGDYSVISLKFPNIYALYTSSYGYSMTTKMRAEKNMHFFKITQCKLSQLDETSGVTSIRAI